MAAIRAVTKACRHPIVHPKIIKSHGKYKLVTSSKKYHAVVEKSLDAAKTMHDIFRPRIVPKLKEQHSFKEVFAEAMARGESIESVARSVYKTFNQLQKSEQAQQEFADAFIQFTIQEAVIKKDHRLLKNEFALSLNIDATEQEVVSRVLNEIKTPMAKRLASDIEALKSVPFDRHKLSVIDSLAICIFSENVLTNSKQSQKNFYYRGCDIDVSRTLFIEPARNTFSILSKRYGERQAEGGFKRVTDAVEIAHVNDVAKVRLLVRLVNKADERISDRELDFEKLYGRIISWYRYPSKKRPYEEKIFFLQEAYDHDLYMFTEYTSEKLRKKIDHGELIDVLIDVGKTIETMHNDNVVHHDVKSKNVLYRKHVDGKVEAKLIDFGHTYRPGDLQTHLRKRRKGYGTLRYSSPDLLEHPQRRDDILMIAKAEDMFALGCLFYEVYMQKKTPWAEKVYYCLKHDDSDRKTLRKAVTLQKDAVNQFEEMARKAPTEIDKMLLKIGARLLDSNPDTRIKISEFLKAMEDIKTRYRETTMKGKYKIT